MKTLKTFDMFNSMPITIIKNKIIDFVHVENPSVSKDNFITNGLFMQAAIHRNGNIQFTIFNNKLCNFLLSSWERIQRKKKI